MFTVPHLLWSTDKHRCSDILIFHSAQASLVVSNLQQGSCLYHCSCLRRYMQKNQFLPRQIRIFNLACLRPSTDPRQSVDIRYCSNNEDSSVVQSELSRHPYVWKNSCCGINIPCGFWQHQRSFLLADTVQMIWIEHKTTVFWEQFVDFYPAQIFDSKMKTVHKLCSTRRI